MIYFSFLKYIMVNTLVEQDMADQGMTMGALSQLRLFT